MRRDLTGFVLSPLLALVAVAACAGSEGDAPPARASIDPGIGIAGIRLDDRTTRVRGVLGPPDAIRPSDLHGGWTTWVYGGRGLRVTMTDGGRVWNVRTLSRSDRTADRVGVGSSEPEVRRAYPGMSCGPRGGPDRYRGWRVCSDLRAPDAPFTSLTLVRGRVAIATVARGLAV